ncbi:MAG: sporulation protein YqfC [Clostridium sp.]
MGKNIKENLAEKLLLPKDIVLNMPVIKIVGNKEILIDNHRGILEYTDTKLKIKSEVGVLSIWGKNFKIKDINDESIFILGILDGFEFIK